MFGIIVQMRKSFVALLSAVCLCVPLVGCGSADERTVHNPDGDTIAKLTVYATSERGKVAPMLAAAGHAYVSVENLSGVDMILGKGYLLPAGETVTIASWEMDAHGGVWYNIEPTYKARGWYDKRKSVTRNVDENSLERINAFLCNEDNDNWTLFHNCVHFATGMWNEAARGSGDDIATDGLLTPADLISRITEFKEYEVARPYESDLPTGYFDENGFKEFKLVE